MANYAIEMRGITKTFSSLVANDNIDLLVESNTIHGIIGENGAGKSTLMSILFGLYSQDHGSIKINGEDTFIKSPQDAAKHRIGMVHQHFKLVGIKNAVDNIILGNEPLIGKFFVNRRLARKKIEELAIRYKFNVNLRKPVAKLTVGQQQKVEILKTLFLDSDILIFDEPTAVLTPQEIEGFLELLVEFKNEGKTIIIITHKLEEIKAVCSSATVIRHGKVINRFKVSDVSTSEMAKMMVGNEIIETKNTSNKKAGEVVVKFQNVSNRNLHNVSFEVKAGEIFAIAGVEGNGQSDIINLLTGLDHSFSGDIGFRCTRKHDWIFKTSKQVFMAIDYIKLNCKHVITFLSREFDELLCLIFKNRERKIYYALNKQLEILPDQLESVRTMSIGSRVRLGMAHIPEDRHKHGLLLDMKLKYAIAVKKIKEFSKFGLINENKISKYAVDIIEKYDIRGANKGETISRQLSGGNQQKAIIGREIESNHHFMVVAQPTRGLDVGAIRFVHEQIIAEKEKGKAILLLSYELNEVLALADRIAVINKGQVVDIVEAKQVKKEEVGLMMAGIRINKKERT